MIAKRTRWPAISLASRTVFIAIRSHRPLDQRRKRRQQGLSGSVFRKTGGVSWNRSFRNLSGSVVSSVIRVLLCLPQGTQKGCRETIRIRQRVQGQPAFRAQLELPGFLRCYPFRNPVTHTLRVDDLKNQMPRSDRLSRHMTR